MLNRNYSKAEERWANLKSAEQDGWFKVPRTRKEVAILMTGNDDGNGINGVATYVKKGFLNERRVGNYKAIYSLGNPPAMKPVDNLSSPEVRAKARASLQAKREKKTKEVSLPHKNTAVKIEVNGVAITAGVEDTIKIIKALQ